MPVRDVTTQIVHKWAPMATNECDVARTSETGGVMRLSLMLVGVIFWIGIVCLCDSSGCGFDAACCVEAGGGSIVFGGGGEDLHEAEGEACAACGV